MKTALDWLIEQMPYEFRAKYAINLFQKAKELEKEQIIDAHLNGQSDHHFSLESRMAEAEQHYNETYNQKK